MANRRRRRREPQEVTPCRSRFAPAVELAVYRIVTEALTNVVRHANATRCHVVPRTDGSELALSITDDGHGLAADSVPGVGLRSMYERAAELGGRGPQGLGH